MDVPYKSRCHKRDWNIFYFQTLRVKANYEVIMDTPEIISSTPSHPHATRQKWYISKSFGRLNTNIMISHKLWDKRAVDPLKPTGYVT
jgi:hypothetical protein